MGYHLVTSWSAEGKPGGVQSHPRLSRLGLGPRGMHFREASGQVLSPGHGAAVQTQSCPSRLAPHLTQPFWTLGSPGLSPLV